MPTTARALALILCTTVGLFLVNSLLWLARARDPTQLQFTNGRTIGVVVVEVLMLLIWVPYLRRHGWSAHAVTRPFRWSDVATAFVVTIATLLVIRIIFVAVWYASPPLGKQLVHYHATGPLSWWAAAPLLAINPIFEELLYLGFAATAVRQRWGVPAAFCMAVALRMLVHVYQGPLAMVNVLPLSILWAAYYLRTNRLWPLILSHAALDLFAVAAIMRSSA